MIQKVRTVSQWCAVYRSVMSVIFRRPIYFKLLPFGTNPCQGSSCWRCCWTLGVNTMGNYGATVLLDRNFTANLLDVSLNISKTTRTLRATNITLKTTTKMLPKIKKERGNNFNSQIVIRSARFDPYA